MSAGKRMLNLLCNNVGTVISRDDLAAVAGAHDWQRSIRTLRQEGWQIEAVKDGYILHSAEQIDTGKKRFAIDAKLRYAVLHRDGSKCQRCGRTPADGVKLVIDHKVPVDWGGSTELDNLWALCTECNGGKKNFFSDYDAEIMKQIVSLDSGWQRLKRFFELVPNEIIEPIKLDVVSGIRDWERTLRAIREKEKMDIKWIPKSKEYPHGGYVYTP